MNVERQLRDRIAIGMTVCGFQRRDAMQWWPDGSVTPFLYRRDGARVTIQDFNGQTVYNGGYLVRPTIDGRDATVDMAYNEKLVYGMTSAGTRVSYWGPDGATTYPLQQSTYCARKAQGLSCCQDDLAGFPDFVADSMRQIHPSE
jgi:hypothetical protein